MHEKVINLTNTKFSEIFYKHRKLWTSVTARVWTTVTARVVIQASAQNE